MKNENHYQFSLCKDCKYLQGCYYQNNGEFSKWPYFINEECLKQGEIND
jgi:hypothetical protein